MTVTLLPDAESLLVRWLKNQPDLAALHGGRVGTRLAPVMPAIRVQLIGGFLSDEWEDQPLLQVECWAADEVAASTMARTVVAALPTVRGTYDAGRVWTFVIESRPFSSPDDPSLSLNSRYVLTVRLLVTN